MARWDTISFDKVAGIYDATRDAPPAPIMDALADVLRGATPVLEIGVGSGRIAAPLQARGITVTGVDVSRSMLEIGLAKGVERVLLGDARRMPFPARTFGAVVAVHVLHLLADLETALKEVRRVCRGLLLTLAYRAEPDDWPGKGYTQAVIERGFVPNQRFAADWHLAKAVEPVERRLALVTEEMPPFEPQIDSLERRVHSVCWGVPDDIHRAAIAELRERYHDPRPPARNETFVFAWNVASLTDDVIARVERESRLPSDTYT